MTETDEDGSVMVCLVLLSPTRDLLMTTIYIQVEGKYKSSHEL